MKKILLGVILGLCIGILSFAYAEIEAFTAIKANFKVLVNGQGFKTDKPIVVVNGNTYLPLKALGDSLGVKVNWNNDLKQVEIGESLPISKYNRSNPCPIGESQILNVSGLYDNYIAEITITDIVRGDNALSMLKQKNEFNDNPKNGYDYILIKIKYNLLKAKDERAMVLYDELFDLYSNNNIKYDSAGAIASDPEFNTQLYQGSSYEGWGVYQVKTEDLAPKLTIGQNYDGSGGIWFKAYK